MMLDVSVTRASQCGEMRNIFSETLFSILIFFVTMFHSNVLISRAIDSFGLFQARWVQSLSTLNEICRYGNTSQGNGFVKPWGVLAFLV
jgi:hypothetical protein